MRGSRRGGKGTVHVKTLAKVTLLLACFISAWVLLMRKLVVGSLSPSAFGATCGLLIGAFCLVGMFGVVKRTAQSLRETPSASVDPAIREQRTSGILAGKLVIILLVLGLVTGIGKVAKELPVWETLAVVAMNLGLTGSLIWVVVRLQKSLKK